MKDSPKPGPAIEFRNVEYRLDNGTTLLRNLNLEIQRGETLVLLGRSGSGKTTTLKLINRLHTQSAGALFVDGRSLDEWDLIRLRRMIGYVIQDVGLFPHFTVAAISESSRRLKDGLPIAFSAASPSYWDW